MDLRQVYDDLIRFETDLWNGVDASLQRDRGVSLAVFNALLVIGATPQCRVWDLARAVSITVGGASQAVDRLEARGLAVRRPNPADRRSSIVELTASGRDLLEKAGALFDEELRTWFSSDVLTDNELVGFAEALRRLRAAANLRRADEDQ
jgi:DNA-binding MarR family transcriptional regulator